MKRILLQALNYIDLVTPKEDIKTKGILYFNDNYIQSWHFISIWMWYILVVLFCRSVSAIIHFFIYYNTIYLIYSLVFIFILFLEYGSYAYNINPLGKISAHFSSILRASTKIFILLILDKSFIVLINLIF